MSATSDRVAATRTDPRPERSAIAPVDASMRLLREVMEHPVDPAYELAARNRTAGAGRSRTAVLVTVLLALVCGWVLTRGVAELRRPEPGQAAGRAALEREITRRTAVADAQQQTIQRLRAEIAAAEQAQLTSPQDVEIADRARALALATGEVPVAGPGVQITLRDAEAKDTAGAVVDPRAPGPDEGRVLDRDVQIVVNGLWAAGAEAISINGRRLTAVSAIRSAGQAILVDFRPLVPPYVVSAIGDPATLQTGFTAGAAGSAVQILRDNYGIGVDMSAAADLRLPGAGTFELRTARPVVETPPVETTPSPSGSASAPPAPATSASASPSTEVTP